eukprot:1965715-Pyramimonas_sp.AAC.1
MPCMLRVAFSQSKAAGAGRAAASVRVHEQHGTLIRQTANYAHSTAACPSVALSPIGPSSLS